MEQQAEGYIESPDRRKNLRIPLIVLKVTEETDRSTLFGYATQISRGGLFISSIRPRNLGERFRITFDIPNTKISIECECEVIWNRQFRLKSKLDPGYGIKFIDLPDSILTALDDWIAAQG